MDNVYNLVYNCTFIGFVGIICVDIVVYNVMCISRNFVNCVIFLYNLSSDIIPVMTTIIFLQKRLQLPGQDPYGIR